MRAYFGYRVGWRFALYGVAAQMKKHSVAQDGNIQESDVSQTPTMSNKAPTILLNNRFLDDLPSRSPSHPPINATNITDQNPRPA